MIIGGNYMNNKDNDIINDNDDTNNKRYYHC